MPKTSFQREQDAFDRNLQTLNSLPSAEHQRVMKVYEERYRKTDGNTKPPSMPAREAIACALRDCGYVAIYPTYMDDGAEEYEEIMAMQDIMKG